MDKKYQVFISSTYLDMKAERQAAVEAILDAGHIPAGMELFSASDKKQIEVIRGWIDRSDIFMLILGGRYGSVDPETGKSYIQLEYEHAVETGKPFFALYLTHEAINAKVKLLGTDAIEQNDTKKLNEFRTQVKSRLCSEVADLKDIKIHAPKSIRDLSAANELEGWVRASSVTDVAPLIHQLKVLQQENDSLKMNIRIAESRTPSVASDASGAAEADEIVTEASLDVQFDYIVTVESEHAYDGNIATRRETKRTTYLNMFLMLGPELLERPTTDAVREYINKRLKEMTPGSWMVEFAEASFQQLKMKLSGLNVLDLKDTNKGVVWSLTRGAKALLMELHRDA